MLAEMHIFYSFMAKTAVCGCAALYKQINKE